MLRLLRSLNVYDILIDGAGTIYIPHTLDPLKRQQILEEMRALECIQPS